MDDEIQTRYRAVRANPADLVAREKYFGSSKRAGRTRVYNTSELHETEYDRLDQLLRSDSLRRAETVGVYAEQGYILQLKIQKYTMNIN